MKRIRIIAVLLAGIFGASSVNAQEVLTLQQAIKYALENKADAKKSALDLENAQYQIDEVRAGGLPQINGQGSLTYNPLIQENAITMTPEGGASTLMFMKFGQPWQAQAAVSVNQQIFNQALFTGLKAAKTTKEFYQINKELTDEQLIEKVAGSYYDVFQSHLQLQTIDNNLNSTTKTRDVIKGLVDAGLGRKIDLDRINVAVNNLKANRQIVINALELKENAMKFAIGMPIQEKVNLPKETFEVNQNTAMLEEYDLSTRTEIKLLEKQTQLLELNRDSKKADYYPNLSLTGNLGYMGIGEKFPFFGNAASKSAFSAIGLNLSIPIFNGGLTKARINQATIQLKQAEVELENTKLALSLANDNARAQIKNSLLTINTNRSNVGLAKEVLSDTENNYKNGLATLTEVLDAENAYADAQNNLNTSLLNFKIAEIQLIKAKGQLKTLVNEK
ncbi:TolC family protein [Sphingobacterium yanglingense]|uniref:Outer membrane protein TolC n=1 Tax=Sphingobacterium yanglingense TaxID=1437280 RepID=A0A4R6WGH2_9SPHI|nr:TolC family protein [Sphingobacterium yanglingense]TDQ77277.1 outer membrane protein TolC [Sphingobacterium yanglingense]